MSGGHVSYTLVGHCAGSAALSWHLLGSTRAIVPYQGSKWRYRKELTSLLEELGHVGKPKHVWLKDTGPWWRAHAALFDLELRATVIDCLRVYALKPRESYDQIMSEIVPTEQALFAAQFLFLQRLAFSGKAVGTRDFGDHKRWSSPGFNETSAFGTPATDKFGKINPMVPSMIRVLEKLPECRSWSTSSAVSAESFTSSGQYTDQPIVDFIDPPYVGSTRYPNGHMARKEVVDLALRHARMGHTVIVCEAEPIPALMIMGWQTRPMGQRKGGSPFKTTKEEWVTYVRGRH